MAVLSERLNESNSTKLIMEAQDQINWGIVDIPRKVGFDRIVVELKVDYIDWETFDIVLDSENGLPEKTLYVKDCRMIESCLRVCQSESNEHWYNMIKVVMGNSTFTMKVIKKRYRIEKCTFEICIPDMIGHERLGNAHNMNCQEEQEYVRFLMEELKRYGIYVYREHAILTTVELNLNLFIIWPNLNFEGVKDIFAPCMYGEGNLITTEYGEQTDENIIIPCFEQKKIKTIPMGIKEKRTTSLNKMGKDVKMKIYDKRNEVIEKSGKEIDFMQPLTRIEFTLENEKKIYTKFGNKANLFDLSQNEVERVFRALVNQYINIPIRAFYRAINKWFEEYFSQLDITQRGWKKIVVNKFINVANIVGCTIIISKKDIYNYIGCIKAKSVEKNRSRIYNKLLEEFSSTSLENVRITENEEVEEMLNFLRNVGKMDEAVYEQDLMYIMR